MAETVNTGQHMSAHGPLFLLYLLHILGFGFLALWIALRPAPALPPRTPAQLRLVRIGILLTVETGFVTNAGLPYWFGNFHYIDIGMLTSIFFLAVVAYAAVTYRLFNPRLLVRATVVFGLLIALELYQLAVGFLADLLPLGDAGQRHVAAAFVALTINAFTHEPLRKWLEHLADKLMREQHKPATDRPCGHR